MRTHEQLLTHPQPVDKTAALHIAGGDKHGRDELLWAQREAFDRAVTEVRIQNMAEEQESRLNFARSQNQNTAEYTQARERLDKLQKGTFYKRDWEKHVSKLHKQGPHFRASCRVQAVKSRGAEMDRAGRVA